jgi:ABC-type uncharacterized transport system permease subunit
MAETSILWLRVAAALYSLGLLHAILTLTRRRQHLFRVAVGAFAFAAVLHGVSLVEQAVESGHFPANNFFESVSLCALIITVLYLVLYRRYKLESLSVFIFPLVFVMTLMATLANPVSEWSSPAVRGAWLTVHVVFVLLGYAALLLTAAAAVVYLIQERELKRKKPRQFYYRLPPLGTLDDLISKAMAFGLVFITLAVIAGSTWAFIELKRRWILEPKILISILTWGIYMAMVFLRLNAGWRGRKAAIIALVALGCSAITWAAHAQLRSLLTP